MIAQPLHGNVLSALYFVLVLVIQLLKKILKQGKCQWKQMELI